jgi:hypothetical protein
MMSMLVVLSFALATLVPSKYPFQSKLLVAYSTCSLCSVLPSKKHLSLHASHLVDASANKDETIFMASSPKMSTPADPTERATAADGGDQGDSTMG